MQVPGICARDGPISHFWSDTDIRYLRIFRYPIIPVPIPISDTDISDILIIMCFNQTPAKSDCISNTYNLCWKSKKNGYFNKFVNHLMFVLLKGEEKIIKVDFYWKIDITSKKLADFPIICQHFFGKQEYRYRVKIFALISDIWKPSDIYPIPIIRPSLAL